MENKIEFLHISDISLKEHRDQNEDGNDHGGDKTPIVLSRIEII